MCDNGDGTRGAPTSATVRRGTDKAFANLGACSRISAAKYIFSRCWAMRSSARNSTAMSFQKAVGLYNPWGYFSPPLHVERISNRAAKPATTRQSSTRGGRSASWSGTCIVAATLLISSDTGMSFTQNSYPRGRGDCQGKEGDSKRRQTPANTRGTCPHRFADVLLMKAEALI